MDLFVIVLLLFSAVEEGKRKIRGEKSFLLLLYSEETFNEACLFSFAFSRYHGFVALIRLLCELPASHPLGT